MSDSLCVGVCMMDWDAGVCLGCGRTQDEIDGVSSVPDAAEEANAVTSSADATSDRTPA